MTPGVTALLHTPTQKVSVGIKNGVPQVRNTVLSLLGPVSLVQRTKTVCCLKVTANEWFA